MTVDEVTALLRFTSVDTTTSAYLTAIVPMLTDYAREYCNQAWTDDALPGPVKIFIAQAAKWLMEDQGVTNKTLGDGAVSFANSLPATIVAMLRPYKRVRFV
jgi:hypothetical protein